MNRNEQRSATFSHNIVVTSNSYNEWAVRCRDRENADVYFKCIIPMIGGLFIAVMYAFARFICELMAFFRLLQTKSNLYTLHTHTHMNRIIHMLLNDVTLTFRQP